MTEHGKKAIDEPCTHTCVMKGAKYVFVTDGTVVMMKDQNRAALHRSI